MAGSESSSNGVEVETPISVKGPEEARMYEAQGFMTPQEVSDAAKKNETEKPKTRVAAWLDKLQGKPRSH